MQVHQTAYWRNVSFILENSDFSVLAYLSLSLGGWESWVAPFYMLFIILCQLSLTNSGTEVHFAFCGQKAAKKTLQGSSGPQAMPGRIGSHPLAGGLAGGPFLVTSRALIDGQNICALAGSMSECLTPMGLCHHCVRLLACPLTYLRQLKLLNKKKQASFAGPLTIKSVWPIVCTVCQTSL